MVAQLLKKLGAEGAVAAEELAELQLPVEGVREQMRSKSRELLAVKHALEVENKGVSVAVEELQCGTRRSSTRCSPPRKRRLPPRTRRSRS